MENSQWFILLEMMELCRFQARYECKRGGKDSFVDNDTGCYQADETSCIHFKVNLVYLTEQALKLKHVAKDPKWHLVSTNASKWFLW